MKALRLVAIGTPGKFEICELPDPVPGPGDVVVDVRACGLNHLDLWLESGGLPIPVPLPRTPGGEIAGTVSAVGSDVKDWSGGDSVALQSNVFCGECEYCRRGDESLCLRGEIVGIQRDGGFATKVCVPARALVRLPPNVDFETSAALTLAGSTAMHMLTNRTEVFPGHWTLVIGGASGVGSAAIQIAKKLGAHVITTGSTEQKRKLGLKLGAEFAIDTAGDWPAEVRRITGKRGVDLVIEHVGGEVLVKCFDCLARGGTIVTCGATAGREIQLKLWPFFVKQHQLIGSYGRNRADLSSTLEWAATGDLRPVIDSVVSLEELPSAFARLRSRNVSGKIVMRSA